jgi:hypothetical protein
MNFNILSWDNHLEYTKGYLGDKKPLVTVTNATPEQISYMTPKLGMTLPIKITGTEIYDVPAIKAKFVNIRGGTLTFLLDYEWKGYPYTLGVISILDGNTQVRYTILPTYSNMGIRLRTDNKFPQNTQLYDVIETPEYIRDRDIFAFRRKFIDPTKGFD